MNCVLSAAGLSRVNVPTIYCEDYLLPLMALGNNADAKPLVADMTRIQYWSAGFEYSVPRDPLRARLSACHAFEEDVKRSRVVFLERPGWMLAGIICEPGLGMRRGDLHNRAAARPLLCRLKTDQHTVLDLDSGADLH